MRWLDVGCGNGAFTEALIARAAPAAIAGVDPSEDQLAFARKRPGAKGAEFRVSDAESLPFPDRHFDGATMALVISFLSDPAKAIAEMARVVKPGGPVATYMWDFEGVGGPQQPLNRALAALGLAPPPLPSAKAARRDALRALWQQTGLTDIETRTIGIDVRFADFDDLWRSFDSGIGPAGKVLAAMPAAEKEKVRAAVRASLPHDAEGRIAYGAVANAVKGRVKA